MKGTCKDCKDRTVIPNCHMTCEKYLKFAEERKKIQEENKARVEAYYTKCHSKYRKW